MSADAALADLCRAMGLSPRAPLVLDLGDGTGVRVERREAGLAVMVTRPAPPHREEVATAALRAVGPDRILPRPVHAGLLGDDTLVMLAFLGEGDSDLPALDSTLRLLRRLAEEAAP